jgi:hypothetical protein
MGCDIESTVKNRGKIMDYMLFQAVGFNYKDEGECVDLEAQATCYSNHLLATVRLNC